MTALETHALRQALLGTTLYGSDRAPYQVSHLLGEGVQGLVFRAQNAVGHDVVVKVLRPDRIADDTLIRFRREAQVMKRLSATARPCTHLVRFYDHATIELPRAQDGTLALPFTVMEYVPGTTLERAISAHQSHAFSLEHARLILSQIGFALAAMHAEGIVHRDLKPSNVLLGVAQQGMPPHAKVMDFGLAKILDAAHERTAYIAGASLGYAPPEQYEQGNTRIGPATDVFALAAIFYELLTGHRAFAFVPGENPLTMLPRIMLGPRPTLLTHRERLPQLLRERPDLLRLLDVLLIKSFAAQPAQRPSTPADLVAAIDAIVPHATNHATAQVAPEALWAAGAHMARRRGATTPPHANASPTQAGSTTPARLVFEAFQGGRPQLNRVVAATFAAHGGIALVLAREGLFLASERATQGCTGLRALRTAQLTGMLVLPDHSVVLFGERGVVVRVNPELTQVQTLPSINPNLDFSAGCALSNRRFALLGKRNKRSVALVFDGASSTEWAFSAGVSVHALCGTDDQLLAVGAAGFAATRTRSGVMQAAHICDGDLLASVQAERHYFVVGRGGHALQVSHELRATLERVDTTRDLRLIERGSDNSIWAAGEGGRLLLRTQGGWKRMDPPGAIEAPMVALWASRERISCMLQSGIPMVASRHGAP